MPVVLHDGVLSAFFPLRRCGECADPEVYIGVAASLKVFESQLEDEAGAPWQRRNTAHVFFFFSSSAAGETCCYIRVQRVCNNTLLRCLSVYDEKCSRMQPWEKL